MKPSNIPKAWRDALAAIQRIVPDAVLAGGCLRDRFNKVKVKDLDIFIPAQTSKIDDVDRLAQILTEQGWQNVRVDHAKLYPEGCDTRIVGIVDTVYPDCPPIQLIVGEFNMTHLFDHFDFGICQIAYDGKELRWSSEFMHDHIAKRFRVATVRSDEAFISTINRWARLKEKYPTWKFHLGTRAQTPNLTQSWHLP